MDSIYIARQAIYDDKMNSAAFELLYRSSLENEAKFDSASLASCETLINAFIHIGIDDLVGSALAFINLPSELFSHQELLPMFHEQIVLEVLEDVEPTPEVIAGIKNLKQRGFKIALDDFEYDESKIPFLQLADYVKLDVLALQGDLLDETVKNIEPYSVKLIAEKVEAQEVFEHCQVLGFDLYQGYLFSRPQIVHKKTNTFNKAVILDVLAKLQSPDIDFDALEETFSQDVNLSYKLLRYINSAAFSLRREVNSIKDAIVLLGEMAVKNWASLILLSKMSGHKPGQVIVSAQVRGLMLQELARDQYPELQNKAFVCGLFSVLDVLLDTPLIDLLDSVMLSTDIKLAMLDYEGDLGRLLEQVIWFEQGEFKSLSDAGIDFDAYQAAYLKAVKSADLMLKAIQ